MQAHVPSRGRSRACIFWAFSQPMGTICVERPGATGPGTTLFLKTWSPVIASEELNTQNGMHPGTSNPLPSHCPARGGSCQALPSSQPLPEAGPQPQRCSGPGRHLQNAWHSAKDILPGRAVGSLVTRGNSRLKKKKSCHVKQGTRVHVPIDSLTMTQRWGSPGTFTLM